MSTYQYLNDPDDISNAHFLDFNHRDLLNQVDEGLREKVPTDDEVNAEIRRRNRIWDAGHRFGVHLTMVQYHGRYSGSHKAPYNTNFMEFMRHPLDALIFYRGVAHGYTYMYADSHWIHSLEQDRLCPAICESEPVDDVCEGYRPINHDSATPAVLTADYWTKGFWERPNDLGSASRNGDTLI